MVHLDVKRVGKIPDGGGLATHGRGSDAAKAAKRGPGARTRYTYLHSVVDGCSRLAYTEALEDERASTTIGFFARARAFFTANGIKRIHRAVTDNGANYRARDFTRSVEALAGRHQRIRPYPNERARRNAIGVWANHFNYHRPYTASGDQPPASRTPTRANDVMPSYI